MAFFSVEFYCFWLSIFVPTSMFALHLTQSAKQGLSHLEDIPFVSSIQRVLPRVLSNTYFACSAVTILQDGFRKFGNSAFQFMRNDGRIIVLPQSVINELSALPSTIVSGHGALERDLLGQHTGLDLILESRLHHSIVQRKLTPRLKLLSRDLEAELNDVMLKEVPQCDDWTQIEPYQLLSKVSARLSARALVGRSLCRDTTWLDISINYTENLFRSIVVLRCFPPWTHRILCRMLPSYWACHRYLQSAKTLLGPHIASLLCKSDAGDWSPDVSDPNVMAWLADVAKGSDRDPEKLAHVQVLLALASVHTTLLRMVNVLYDLTANPSHIAPLREEIDLQRNNWSFDSYDALQKLDSVLRESQRLSPPTILGMKRLFKAPFTFSTGLHIPQGTYVCMPTMAIENDPNLTPTPEEFDGFRNFRLRQIPGEQDNHQFASADTTALNFGFGKSACPGRFFASVVIKMVLVKMLTTYDFKFVSGEGRPRNVIAHEFLFPWPWDKIMIRRRTQPECPF